MATSTFQYPSTISRTLDAEGRSLLTVIALHDHEVTDADINLIQDLQNNKRKLLLENKSATSGCLTYAALVPTPFVPNTFIIPAFDVLFNGEVVSIQGFNSADLTQNRITLPTSQHPAFWTQGVTDEDARIYVIFLELWYQALDNTTGQGYYLDPVTKLRYFYPYGCTSPDPTNAESMPDDSVDIFATTSSGSGLFTTQRAQIQWRFNIQRVALTYDFTKFQFGLDPGAQPSEIVYGQGTTTNTTPIIDSLYQFTNMGAVNGDTGIWQAGDGNVNNSLGTMDGYTYAMPMAVMFQRNSGPFSLAANIFGCGDPSTQNSGLLKYGISGRLDSRLADQIFADDVVDTRQTVTLDSWDLDKTMRESFVDLITGNTRYAIGRGDGSGLKTEGLGSALAYYVSVAPTAVPNTNTLPTNWDGFANGFSSDTRTFYVTKKITTTNKSFWLASSAQGGPWMQGDAFTVSLPAQSQATIQSATVQAFNVSNNVKTSINLLSGQVRVTGLGSKSATVTITANLQGTPFDPGAQNIYCTVGVQYLANSGVDLRKTPIAVDGGILSDAISGKNLPVYGISEYEVQTQLLTTNSYQAWAVNPEYSNIVFGTKIWIQVPGSSGTVSGTSTTFTITRTGLNGKVNGFYPTRVWDLATGAYQLLSSISMKGNQCTITIAAVILNTQTLVMSFLAQDTAQLVYNAPVKGVTEIEETVLFGNYTSDSNFPMDSRVSVEVQQYDATSNLTTFVVAGAGCLIKGISGNDVTRYIWILDTQGNLNSMQCSTVNFNNGIATVTVLGDYSHSTFFFTGSILPAFDPNTSLTLVHRYIPYQGEGTLNRNYEVIHNDETALVTTNGSGAAPVVGLDDVYPYNREIPIATTLPALVNWPDATLTNTPLSSVFDSNYVAMRQNNVEHTFEMPLHTNDFIPPMNKDFRKELQFVTATSGGRGFSQAIPHVGFAIATPTARTVLGQNLQSTTAPIILYVNNVSGSDTNDGLSISTPLQTITGALSLLPPVLRHPCSIQLVQTNTAFSIVNLQNTLQTIALGDGTIISSEYYAIGNLAYTIQESGRLVITTVTGATAPAVIDCTGFSGFGNGPTSAFFIDNSRVIFNNITFNGFTNPAIYGIDSEIDFVNCNFTNNLQAGAFEQGCNVVLSGGSLTLPDGGVGMVASSSEITASSVNLTAVSGAASGAFYTAERSATVNLQKHATDTVSEINIGSSTVVALAEFNSSIVVTSDFQTNGSATLSANSILARSVSTNPFLGGVTADTTSNVVTVLT